MCGERPAEVTGAEALRILVDSDHGMQRRIFAPLAEHFAVDVAFGADDRPAVLFGQYHRLFPERDDRHGTSPVRPPLFLGCMFGEICLRLSVFCVVLSAYALRRLLGLSPDLAVEGERALDAVALHHPFGVAGVARERGYLYLEHAEPP